MKKKKYIVGVGNYMMLDDSVGIRLVEYIDEKGLSGDVEALDLSSNILNIFSYFNEETAGIVVVDAAKLGLAPGEYKVFSPNEVRSMKVVGRISSHEGDIVRAIHLASETGYTIPPVVMIGIEPKEVSQEMGLSPELSNRLPEYAKEAFEQLEKF